MYDAAHTQKEKETWRRHRPEFSWGPDDTHDQVMFESPDRTLIEVVYTGPK